MSPSPLLQLLIGGACLVIIVAGMQAAAEILNSFVLALLIAIATTPLLRWLVKHRFPTGLALLLTILVVVGVGLSLIGFLGLSISELLHTLPSYEGKIDSLQIQIVTLLGDRGIDATQLFSAESLKPARLIQLAVQFLKGIGTALSESLLLVFIVAFMLLEGIGFASKLQQSLPGDNALLGQFQSFSHDIRSYIWITTWTGGLIAIADFVVLMLLEVDLAVLWTVLFFLLNFVPAVGFLLAILPPMVLTLLKFGWSKALLLFFCCWLIDNVVDKGIKPKFLQDSLDLSLLVIIASLIIWSWMLGPTGALLAIPLTMMVKKIVLETLEETRFIATLMGSGEATGPIAPEPYPEIEQV